MATVSQPENTTARASVIDSEQDKKALEGTCKYVLLKF